MEMERNSTAEVNAAARSRGMGYGQYVGAAYYPVTIVQVMPDGSRILRTAPVPEPVTAERPPWGGSGGETPEGEETGEAEG